jgi:hypothetical protein
MADFDWGALAAGALQALAISGGLVFAGKQVRVSTEQTRDADRWRRTEFAMSLMERLSLDEELAFCARALDWGVGPLLVPSKYRIMFSETRGKMAVTLEAAHEPDPARRPAESDWGAPESDSQFDHHWGMLARAVLPGLHKHWSDPRMLVFRYCFDAFGEYLETIQRHLDLGNVEPAHLFGIRYYLDLLHEPGYYDELPEEQKLEGVPATEVFRPFMRKYYPDGWHLVEHRHELPAARKQDPTK